MQDDDLDLVETADLVRAMDRRCIAMLLVTAARTKRDDTHSAETVYFTGGRAHALGLAAFAQHYLLRINRKNT